MPRPVYAKKEEIPAGFEDEYAEKDGKWQPIPADDSAALKDTLRKERDRADEAEKERKKLERKLTAAESGDEKDKVSRALAKFDEDAAALKADFEKRLAAKDGELRAIRLDDRAKEAFIKAGGRPERAAQALKLHKDTLDLADDGRIIVKNEKGEPTSATIEDFWSKTVRAELPDFYTGTKASGGSATGGASRSQTVTAPGKWDGDAVLADPLAALNAANMADAK